MRAHTSSTSPSRKTRREFVFKTVVYLHACVSTASGVRTSQLRRTPQFYSTRYGAGSACGCDPGGWRVGSYRKGNPACWDGSWSGSSGTAPPQPSPCRPPPGRCGAAWSCTQPPRATHQIALCLPVGWTVPTCTRTPRECAIYPSFKDQFLSPRAKTRIVPIRTVFAVGAAAGAGWHQGAPVDVDAVQGTRRHGGRLLHLRQRRQWLAVHGAASRRCPGQRRAALQK